MATETPELLPCPFCGGDAVLGYEYEINSVYVNCSRCHCGTGYIDEDADAVKAWNTRAELADDLKAATDKIERYEGKVGECPVELQAWRHPLTFIPQLINATGLLLNRHDYDGPDHEECLAAKRAAQMYLKGFESLDADDVRDTDAGRR